MKGTSGVRAAGPVAATLSPAASLLMLLWIVVEAGLLATFFWVTDQGQQPNPDPSRSAAVLLGVGSVLATLVLSLVWWLCGPSDRRGRAALGALAVFAWTVWTGLEQAVSAAPRQTIWFVQSAWQLSVPMTLAPLLLVWWLWGVFATFFFYRYFRRGRLSNSTATEDIRLRSSQLMRITLLVSITAGGSRLWIRLLPVESEATLKIAYVFGFGILAGLCFLCLTIGLMKSAGWGFGALALALLATIAYAEAVGSWFPRTLTVEWIVLLLVSLAAGLVHYAVFLLPLRAGGYRLCTAPAAGPRSAEEARAA